MAGVRVENLCKNFDGSTNVVDNISFEINDQEFVVKCVLFFVHLIHCSKD